ncbi:MAG TPA: NADP-dependent glyceraldehyde-3-phosphate dehydrogenase [Pseudomonas sp.]|mgnify:FL=1|jgi:glyceraldehyde-3-phosphate dehydrogenase (NADP+)|uniref:NADP-dependent glyceraldehyde-3-phosphate dehydrogenase n=1 Tax=Stutzerimonas frequens TaxID=2968969 RepID=UPI0007B8E04A|nr:NADP-dependent glyceraldehyde-3-phosphate dehydrogenase [Stutzerimonas frequens]MBA4727351.1 NADP-dependent glyceraldehyde-3-phosphate dehydrogenase [Pseudomonas sp.]MEC7471768.1 NADP-dependent glyceraldehyde-3-phosphate dehydrogenase [Pseudomonadota bacterium]KZX57363.1 aldehyde dehydrogenase [Stutzerimonas frequens]MBK3919754.1 aldehyde dehydrogenase family protein [Stutzerimonas frequens]HAW62523.1 NADP-dependent glyceraldehyde-3-phosphate dehydrogenase [Pseudomonas sp.]|tara:strand:- start:225 stop:1853 length:1629 start_codon:yes stop_codon:yes gene_type:complete
MTTARPLAELFPRLDEIPAAYQPDAPVEQRDYLLDGELRQWHGPLAEVRSPVFLREADGNERQVVLGSTPLLDADAALSALDAAVAAYDNGRGAWPTMRVAERIAHVEAFLARMREQREAVVKLLMWEIGKNLKDSEKEFDRTCDYIVDTIHALKELDRSSSRFELEQGTLGQIRRVPMGVALCMGPYNYPLNETFTTLIPALIMGNTVVFKPAKFGVLLIRPLLEAFRDSFPAGVINVIYGRGRETVSALMASGKIDVFAFIGTHKGAADLKKLHPRPHRLRAALGLDAKNPGIVLPQVDLDNAVEEAVTGALSFNGQRCTALKILFVHETVLDDFLERLAARVNALKPGMPWEPGVALTPLPEPGKTDYLHAVLEDAVAKGARVINAGGGESHQSFFQPAVLSPVDSSMRVYHEEQFGPLVPVVPYRELQEVIDYVTASDYGQQLSIFGNDPAQVGRLVDAFVNQVGRININAQCQRGPDSYPFNGRKNSAEGTLSVHDALRVFSIRTLVATRFNEGNKELVDRIIRDRQSSFLTTDYIF